MLGFIGDVWWLCCGWIIVGGLAGGVARFIMRSDDRPFISDLLLGIAGSVVGGIVLGFFIDDPDQITPIFIVSSFIVAVVGSMILIFIGRIIFGTGR